MSEPDFFRSSDLVPDGVAPQKLVVRINVGTQTVQSNFSLSLVTMINPASLLLADALAAAVTWRELYRHGARGILTRTSFTSVLLCDGT